MMRADIWAAVLLAAIAIGLYLPTLGAEFVYDARMTVMTNDYPHHPGHLLDVATLRVMHLDVMDNNRPVYLASVILNWALWGNHPWGHHLCNVLLHGLVVMLLFRLCRRIAGDAPMWTAFGAALLYAVHPLNCESVSEVSYRNDLMVAAFLLGALNLATLFQPVFSRRNAWIAAACVACSFLAVGSKENGVAVPMALIAYWLFFRRNESRAGWLALCAASGVVVGLFLLARFLLPPAHSSIFVQKPHVLGGSVEEAVLIQPRIWACYFRQIIWPRGLCADYGPWSVRNFEISASILSVLAVTAAQIVLAAQSRVFALGAVVFWSALLPVSNLVMPIYRPMADRFLYVPMLGMALMAAAIFSWARRKPWNVAVATLLVPAACALSWSTFQREKVWHDSLSLWSNTSKRNPYSSDAVAGFAGALYDAGAWKESVPVFERAITLSKGKAADQFACMALALDAAGRTSEADDAWKKATTLDSRYRDPDALVKALIWERKDAEKLRVIVERNARK